MAITTTETIDIKVIGEYRLIQIDNIVRTFSDGKEISNPIPNTRTLTPMYIKHTVVDNVSTDTIEETDLSEESADIQAIAAQVWTQAVKDAYTAKLNG